MLVGPRAFGVLEQDSRIDKKIIYDKTIPWKEKAALWTILRAERYDLVIDLRQTMFGLFLGARYRSSIFTRTPKSVIHMKDRHLWKLNFLGLRIDGNQPLIEFGLAEQQNVERLFSKWQIDKECLLIAISPGARNMTKRWGKEGFARVCRLIREEYKKAKIIMVGDQQDSVIAEEIIKTVDLSIINACGQTTLSGLACLLSRCRLLIANDSAPMHLAWAVGTPVAAIFGPTDYRKYAPCGSYDRVIRKALDCSPCRKSLCPQQTRECMQLITAEEVFAVSKEILNNGKRI
ncbi:MAG: glycosyltransferase family 9 protein [Candidatus Omnitrophota bacterium]